jgi:hypothetical protein
MQRIAPPFTGAHQTERTRDVCLLTNGNLKSVRWHALVSKRRQRSQQ